MYNRYIPNANGSFDCQRIPTPSRPKPQEPHTQRPPAAKPQDAQTQKPAAAKPQEQCAQKSPAPRQPSSSPKPGSGNCPVAAQPKLPLPGHFHLPENLDSGDLLVLLILLLILQEGEEDPLSILLALGAFLLFQ